MWFDHSVLGFNMLVIYTEMSLLNLILQLEKITYAYFKQNQFLYLKCFHLNFMGCYYSN